MIESSSKKEGWPECFQDLGSWCPLPQDELHTPKVNLQDEFNFSNDDGYVNDWDQLSSPVDLQCDQWVNDSQLGLSSCQSGIGDLNNTVIQEGIPLGTIQKTANILGSGGKLLTVTSDRSRSPLKSKGNVLLSQGIVKSVSEDSTLLNMAATLEHKSKDSIVIANNCYLLPVTVPEFDSAKLNSSSLSTSYLTTTTTTPPPLQLSLTQASLPPTKKVSIVKGNTLKSALSNQTNIRKNVDIKEEDLGLEKCFKLPPVAIEGENDMEPVQVQRRVKPQLKLNIAAANNASKFTTTLSTPEVLRPLVDEDTKEFNLLQYVCNDGEYSGLIQEDEEENRPEEVHRDHDYSTDPYTIADLKSDLIIKCEPGSPASTSCTVKKSNTKRGRPKRKRQRDDSSDYVVSDSDESLSEGDSQQEWSPTLVKRKKRKSSTNSNKSKSNFTGGRKSISRRISTSSSNNNLLDIEEPTHDKYRALRERNNEASRRSRMNRKQRDVEMLQQADELHKKNLYLKARADKMESLVKYMRAEIMKALTKPK